MTRKNFPSAKEIRGEFLSFFEEKGHRIVSSAPIVTRDDPTLMFTNAGMNQFKDYFLGYKRPDARRVADTQKCLRVSGKHNDLEEVGRDSYHHTMFEMLGNWSFGDYFKNEAIDWAWELLIDRLGLEPDRLYATIFAGDPDEGLGADEEAEGYWKKYIPLERILRFGRKDNFWEMGDTGPCGPCSEIHIDLRPGEERKALPGSELVNRDHPMVVEIWNLVFIQYNRKANGRLEELPERHVDTGMGFERLCMALQGKRSNYETDVFTGIIGRIEKDLGIRYTNNYAPDAKTDIAIRVLSDHLRAVAFTIADGELPGNTGAGYVIRRILRRAIRYYYSFLDREQPYLYTLVPVLAEQFSDVFPELKAQEEFVARVIEEEEKSFLRTLSDGLRRIRQLDLSSGVIGGKEAFELYDTYGFPLDLTRLIAEENNVRVDEEGFRTYLEEQKERSRAAAVKSVGDWVHLRKLESVDFVGYDRLEVEGGRIIKYRTVTEKGEDQYQVVLDRTPFYPEGGGQVGDRGYLEIAGERIRVLDTVRDHDLVVHVVEQLPTNPESEVRAIVDERKRRLTENNHSATHLLHAALREVLGDHVQQKGSLVDDTHLRFDFSHYQKVSDGELQEIERLVNRKIREDIAREEARQIPMEEAKAAGAMMLFGEKYGDTVRMITFDPGYSRELCGGCHVPRTGVIGYFKIVQESAVAAGVRRIEAVTAVESERYIDEKLEQLATIQDLLKSPDPIRTIEGMTEQIRELRKKVDKLGRKQAGNIKDDLKARAQKVDGMLLVAERVEIADSRALKTLVFQLEKELGHAVIALGSEINGKPQLMLAISRELTESRDLNAGKLIKEMAREIRGGGGGQPFFASAGGSDAGGLDKAIRKIEELI